MTPFEKYSLWINSIFAFLTLAAIIAAIWGEKIRQIWTKPKLKIMLYEPSLTKTTTGIKGNRPRDEHGNEHLHRR